MRAFLWCNGELPSQEIIDNLGEISPLFGVDGGGNKANSLGFDVKEILGDLDSIHDNDSQTKTTLLENQNFSDLTKTINELVKRGFSEFDILGVDGGDTGCITLEPLTKLACIVVSYHFIFNPWLGVNVFERYVE